MTVTIDNFILTLFAHGFKARTGSLLQILNGKRSSSVLSYGLFYHCLHYIELFPHLAAEDFTQITNRLIKKGYLIHEEKWVKISNKGQELCREKKMLDKHAEMDQFRYGRFDEAFFTRLMFATQVLSELSHEEKNYIPIEQNTFKQYQMKRWLVDQLSKQNQSTLVTRFSMEWVLLVSKLPEREALFLTNQLIGTNTIGRTSEQVGQFFSWNQFESFLFQKHSRHLAMKIIVEEKERLPLMFSLYALSEVPVLNQSAVKTYELYLEQRDIQKLADYRRLKLSTIQEHLIEMAISLPNFIFIEILSQTTIATLLNLEKSYPDYRNWRISDVQKRYSTCSFFDMRLYQIGRVRGEY